MEENSKTAQESNSNLNLTSPNSNENDDKSEDALNKPIRRNSNMNSSDIDSELMEKLRGDAIGDTLYSESFAAKTLLQLSDLKWSEKVEEDLCFLWDMTLEKDVCDYLLKLSYPSIACAAITKYDENRLIEIVIGILANICCTVDVTDLTDEQMDIILSALRTDDALILIQVVRFIKAIAYNRETLPFIDETILEQISFILLNSCNNELLINSLDAVSKITADCKIDANLLNGNLVKSSIVAYQCVCNSERERLSLDEDQIETNQQRTALTHLIQIVSNICWYINTDSSDRLLNEVKENSGIFLEELSKLFSCYSRDESLLPVSEELQFYVDALVFIFQVLSITYNGKVFSNLMIITNILLKNKFEELGLFLELDSYFISVGSLDDIKRDLRCLKKEEVIAILNKFKSDEDFPYMEKVNALLNEYDE